MLCLSSFVKNLQNSTSIKATGMGITTIDNLPNAKCNCTLLSLSFNHISDLSNLKQFSLLTTLHLESNCIERISALEPLSHLHQLNVLCLSGNKVCSLPLFKAHIINLCPHLKLLDGKNVSSFFSGKYSRDKLATFLIQERKCFKSIYINDVIVKVLKYKKKKQEQKQDYFTFYIQSQNYQDKIHDLRLRCKSLSPSSYFKFLKQTMISQNQFIYKTAILLELEKSLITQYSAIIQSFGQINQFNIFIDKSEKLNDISLALIKHTENDFDENIFNEFQPSIQNSSNKKKLIHRSKNRNLLSYSSDSISSQFCNSDDFNRKNQNKQLNKSKTLSPVQTKKKDLFISSDDNDSASLSNDSSSQSNHTKKSYGKLNENEINIQKNSHQNYIIEQRSQNQINFKNNLIKGNNNNTFSSDFEFSSDPLKTSSSSDKEDLKSKNKTKFVHEEEPASEETLPKNQQSVSSELSNFQNHNDETTKSNLFLTELASEEILSKSQQSFTEENPNVKSDTHKHTSTEIDAEELVFERKFTKKENSGKRNDTNTNNDNHIHFTINQSLSPELASDSNTQNTQSNQSDSLNPNKSKNILESNKVNHFPTSQAELASDEGNQETDSAKIMQSLSIEVASSSSSNKDDNFDQLSEGNDNSNFKKNQSLKVEIQNKGKPVQISTSLELASDETLHHSSFVPQQTSSSNTNECDLQRRKNLNDHLKLTHSASLEFASDETLPNTQRSSSAFEDFESDDDGPNKNSNKNKRNQIKAKIINKNVHDENIISQDSPALNNHQISFVEEEELASEEGQNEEHVVLFDTKMKKIRLDASQEKHLKTSQESFSLDEMASGETLPSANPISSDDDLELKMPKKINDQTKNENISENSDNEKNHEKVNNANENGLNNNFDISKTDQENQMIKNKILPPISALSTYFKIWKMNYKFRIKRREMIKARIMTKYNLMGKPDHIKEMQKKQQLMNKIERQKEINKSKYELYKQLNYEYQKLSQSSE